MQEQQYSTRLSRHLSGLTSHRVLEIEDNKIIVQRAANNHQKIKFPVSDIASWKIGDFVDLFVIPTGDMSYQARYIGKTPERFVDPSKDVIHY